jgi:predicted ABC-class ATPase
MHDGEDLRRILRSIDGRGYKSYRDLRGAFQLGMISLHIDRVQGDPFATPSKLRLRVDVAAAQLPAALFDGRVRRRAFADFLARRARDAARALGSRSSGSGNSGRIEIDAGGQAVLARTAVDLQCGWVELRLEVGLPAAGRRVSGGEAEAMLCRDLPEIARRSLLWEELPQAEARSFVECVENQEFIRDRLPEMGLVAFVADGAVLPRASGASERPLPADTAVRFSAPESLRVRMPLIHPIDGPRGPETELSGMGIREGVTLIAGGGYHGKSTLLRALSHGVYPHVPGDGREWVVSRRDLVKVRAEDGRSVVGVGIGGFVRSLPGGRSTAAFTSEDASGSTSQASSIVEAIEAGARGLLLDEDTSASNFMLRDARMQALVSPEDEPITPFVERVRELYDRLGVSTLLVMGGSGDYFDVADCVIILRDFVPHDGTREAREIAARMPTGRCVEAAADLGGIARRVPLPESFDASRGRRDVKIDARGLNRIRFGAHEIDLSGVEQLVDASQTRAVGYAVHLARQRFIDGTATLPEILDRLEALFDDAGLDCLDPFERPGCHPGNFARPRRFEIAAAINRMRSLRVAQSDAPR